MLEIGAIAYYAVFVLLQRFAFRGRLIFGPDARSLYLTIGLIVVPVILFCSLVSQSLVKFFPDNIGRLLVAFPAVFTFYVSFFLTFLWFLFMIAFLSIIIMLQTTALYGNNALIKLINKILSCQPNLINSLRPALKSDPFWPLLDPLHIATK